MKLTQFYRDGKAALGLITQAGIVDVAKEAALRGICAPATMMEAIAAGEEGKVILADLAKNPSCFTEGEKAPVITGNDKILCIGLNYRQHAKECNLPLPPAPVLFNKFSNALAADGDCIQGLSAYTPCSRD